MTDLLNVLKEKNYTIEMIAEDAVYFYGDKYFGCFEENHLLDGFSMHLSGAVFPIEEKKKLEFYKSEQTQKNSLASMYLRYYNRNKANLDYRSFGRTDANSLEIKCSLERI